MGRGGYIIIEITIDQESSTNKHFTYLVPKFHLWIKWQSGWGNSYLCYYNFALFHFTWLIWCYWSSLYSLWSHGAGVWWSWKGRIFHLFTSHYIIECGVMADNLLTILSRYYNLLLWEGWWSTDVLDWIKLYIGPKSETSKSILWSTQHTI